MEKPSPRALGEGHRRWQYLDAPASGLTGAGEGEQCVPRLVYDDVTDRVVAIEALKRHGPGLGRLGPGYHAPHDRSVCRRVIRRTRGRGVIPDLDRTPKMGLFPLHGCKSRRRRGRLAGLAVARQTDGRMPARAKLDMLVALGCSRWILVTSQFFRGDASRLLGCFGR